MKENFEKAFDFVISVEGKMTENPLDPGGITKWGISQRAYPELDIKNLTFEQAREIYRRDYWDKCHCDNLQYPADILIFDTAVNMGVDIAIELRKISNDFFDYVVLRIGKYATYKNFRYYGRGWIRRIINLYNTFKCNDANDCYTILDEGIENEP